MCSKNDLNIILSELAAAYKEVYGTDVVQILLYSSYARGDYDENSDVDITAIVRGNREDLQKKLKLIWERSQELELEYETILSPVVIPYDEYNEYKEALPYYKNIENEGVELTIERNHSEEEIITVVFVTIAYLYPL